MPSRVGIFIIHPPHARMRVSCLVSQSPHSHHHIGVVYRPEDPNGQIAITATLPIEAGAIGMNRSSACVQRLRRNLQRPWGCQSLQSFRYGCKYEAHLPSWTLRIQQFGTKDGSKGGGNNRGTSPHGKSQRVKKQSFAKKFLEPAARGELVKHQSGIPKLAARKTKGHTVKDDFPGKELDNVLESSMEFERSGNFNERRKGGSKANGAGGGASKRPGSIKQEELVALFQGPTEEDLNPDLKQGIKFVGENIAMQQGRFQKRRNFKKNEDRIEYDIWGERVFNDPWETDTIEFTYETPHTESLREAKQIVHPTNRVNPPKEFFETNKFQSFAYVTNVPRPTVDGVLGTYDTPSHRHAVAEVVADAFSVPTTHVFTANMTSAFVGFEGPEEAAEKYAASASKRIITCEKVEVTMYSADGASTEEKEFVTDSKSVIKIEHIPAGFKPGTLARYLHGVINASVDDILISSHTTALVRLSSEEEAKKVVDRGIIEHALNSLQRQILRVFPAKFETVHDKYGGVLRKTQMRKKTLNLLVSGDTPSNDFLMSHASVLHLSNVPISVSKEEISEKFQQFCVQKRDIEGSIEIVKSIDGYPNGRVYVGFDLALEGENAWKEIFANGQRIMLNEAGPAAVVRPVKEKVMIRGEKLGARSERSEEELVASLSEWKEWIDPTDMKELESFGVTIDVLEEAFNAARRNNPTFGVEDQAREGERMRPDKKPGQHFKEFVEMYVETLKELASTRENPGMKYEGLFLPGEDIDYDLFDIEEERLSKLQEEMESYRPEDSK